MRVSLGFTPHWYHARLGVDLGERWHLDPEYRYQTIVQMKAHLHETFPSVPEFAPDIDDHGTERAAATISGVYGILVIPMLYGLEPVYQTDNWPDVAAGSALSKEEISALPPADPASGPHIRELMRQMDWIASHAQSISGYLNYQGVLNIALKVRGSAVFMDMMDDPEWTSAFFAHIGDAMQKTAHLVQERQRESGFAAGVFTVSNCVMNMVSPARYEEFVLPIDRKLSESFPSFGVHTCNWDATPYLDSLRHIGKMGYLDMGTMSDLARAKQLFPQTRRSVLYGPVDLEQKREEEIREDVARIAESYGPCDIALADVENTTPDDRVRFFLEAAREVSARYDGWS